MSKSSSPNIKLSQLKALVAVAECGSFGEAAFQLGLSQPTVSHAIANLEESLGVVLLIRGRNGALLTPAGAQIMEHVHEILHRLDRVVQDANLHKGLHGGQVRVASFRSAAAYLLPEKVVAFKHRYPDVEVTITEHYDYTYVEQEVRDGKADVGITFLPTSSEFECFEICHDPYFVVVPPESQRTTPHLTWEDLCNLPLILYPSDNSCFRDVQAYFSQAGYGLSPRYQFRETSTILSMVRQGLGSTIMPQLSIASMPEGVQIYDLPSRLERIVGAVILAQALHPPAVFAWLSLLEQTGSNGSLVDMEATRAIATNVASSNG